MKRYGYHRTSTMMQHLDRGILEITKYCSDNNLELEKIFTDQMTGKNFNRPRYLILKEDVLRPGDELIVTELDRLGRNKKEILKELQYFRDMEVRVKVLELPTTLVDLSGMDTVSWKPVSSERFDSKAFKEAEPELYAKYVKTSISRRFQIK